MPWPKQLSVERLAQALAVYCFAVLVLLAWKPAFTNASQPVRGIRDPMVAMQMARNVDEVDAVLSDAPSADREVMRIKIRIDLAFIAGYVALAFVMGFGLFRCSRITALALMLLALAAGFENARADLAMLRAVDLPLAAITSPLLIEIEFHSLAKWILLAAASLFLGAFAWTKPRWQTRAIGSVQLCGAALACGGFVANPLLVWAGVLMALGLLLSAATLKLLTHESAT